MLAVGAESGLFPEEKNHGSATSSLPERGGGIVGKGFGPPKTPGISGTDDLPHGHRAGTSGSAPVHTQLSRPGPGSPRRLRAPTLCVCSVQEFMTFTSQLIVERSELGSRASVKEQGERITPGSAPAAAPPSFFCPFMIKKIKKIETSNQRPGD